jgi:hypothetical protein
MGGHEGELHAWIIKGHRLGVVGAKPAVCHVIDRDIDKHQDGQRGGEDRSRPGFSRATQHAVTHIEQLQT